MQMQDIIAGDLCVGPFRPQDAAPFAQAARESAPAMARWMPWCRADYAEADAAQWIAQCASQASDGNAFDVGIYSAGRETFFGGIGINQINRLHKFGNVGYWVRESCRGRGIAVRAVRMMAGFGFGALHLTRLEIVVADGNAPSIAVARRAGATFEGLARQRLLIGEMAHDAHMFSLLSADPA